MANYLLLTFLVLFALWTLAPQFCLGDGETTIIQRYHTLQNRQGGRLEEARQNEAQGPNNNGSSGTGLRATTGPFCDDPEVISTLPFCLNSDYEKHIRPEVKEATHINIKLKITEIEKIDDSNLTMTVHMDFDVQWRDQRLEITENTTIWDTSDPMQAWVILDQELVDDYLWIPDIAVYNLKEFQMSWVLHPMATVDLFPDKTIHYVFAARVTFGCNFFFENFPLDRQQCEFFVGSYGHTKEEMVLNGSYVQLHRDRQRPLQYQTEIVDLEETKKTYQSKNEQGVVQEEYSTAGFKVKMARGYSVFLTRTYFPAALMVIVSFISYLIGQEEVVGRLALLVTLTLIEINIMNQTDNYKVPARTTTALQLYVLVCLMFVCAGLFEYALVLYRDSPVEKKRRECMKRCKGETPEPSEEENDKDDKKAKDDDKEEEDKQSKHNYNTKGDKDEGKNESKGKDKDKDKGSKKQGNEKKDKGDRDDSEGRPSEHRRHRSDSSQVDIERSTGPTRRRGARFYTRPSDEKTRTRSRHKDDADSGEDADDDDDETDKGKSKESKGRQRRRTKSPETIERKLKKACDTKNIDIVSGILFPCLFAIFNLVYWVYFLA